MGVSSSPSCFNRLVQAVFSDQQSFFQTYFDDIFVFTPTDSVEEHLTALEKVFQCCVDQKLYIKLSKCKLCADEIPCLGDFIGREGVRMDQPKAVSSRTGQCPAQNTSSNHFSGRASMFFGSVVISPLSLHHSQNSPRPLWNDGTSRATSLSALLESLTIPDLAEEPNTLFAMRLPSLLEEYRRLRAHDSFIDPILKRLQEPAQRVSAELRHFQDEEGLLYFQPFAEAPRRLCIPEDTALRNRLLFEEHDVPTRGHPVYHNTHIFMAAKFYWTNMVKSVRKYVATCESCQPAKNPRGKPQGLLNPLDVPAARWQDISMDFMVSLPITSTECDAVMLWAGIMKLQNSELHLSTAFQPSTDGQSEVTNKFIIEYLRYFLEPHQTDWDSYLPLGEFAYNSRAHSTTGMTQFIADLGYLPRSVGDLALNTSLDVTRPAS
ncbi:unnamed protein product [Phytophthora fragariaefolia]|uniref:Unnamed protein product n=1 Tax=Phytophthora fragariaefolia TaxID=1490495 RepID=A0A9W7CSP6_9STRA|nr:unnamed protein product [Phytophthora fragariaefolia]